MEKLDFKNLPAFANFINEISKEVGFRVSARGWAYILEQKRFINKGQFDKVNNAINKCRKKGLLPIDFTAEESSRAFGGVEKPCEVDVVDDFGKWAEAALSAAEYYSPDWWDNEEYYVQMVVEKIDLVTLFSPVCEEYHIPIANSKGWSSMLQRAEYARRFAEARDKGLKCVLLYCGDHDPDGLRISEFIRKNLSDLSDVLWNDGVSGYDPYDLIVDRFGLNYDFIEENGFSWIDNLTTGSGKDLASPSHKNHKMPYVQEYLRDIGERKCEANAIVVLPDIARDFVRETIEGYLGADARDRFAQKRQAVRDELDAFLDESGSRELMGEILDNIKNR
jgi:hypothetical protein